MRADLGLCLISLLCACAPSGDARPGRIILVSMDTVRADRVSGFGQVDTTPLLREIAEQGTRFTRFYAASGYTLPAHVSIFTGRDPARHADLVGAESPTLAELLREAGYRTQAFHEGGFVMARYGFDRGFDEYRLHRPKSLVGDALPSLLDWMRAAGEPYFLFLHTYAAHFPYGGYERYRREHPERGLLTAQEIRDLQGVPARDVAAETRAQCTLYNQMLPRDAIRLGCGAGFLLPDFVETPDFESDRAALLRSYDDQIAAVDHALGRMRDVLVEQGQWEDTLLLVTSDHGEAFFEHGHYRHGYVPFEEVLRVPLLVSYPRLLREGGVREVREPAWHLDLLPTILALAGIDPPASLPGLDLSPAMLGRAGLPEDRSVHPLLLNFPRNPLPPRRVALRGSLKYVEGDARFGDTEGLLFDLDLDAGERSNLREQRPDRFAELAARARRWEQDVAGVAPRRRPPPRPEPSAAEREQLRARGYLDEESR